MSTRPLPWAERLWSAVRYGGASVGDMAERPQLFGVTVFSLLAMVSLALFGTLQIAAEHDPRLGYLELAGACAIALNALALQATHNVRLATHLYLLAVLAFLMLMLVTGGTRGTGAFWFFVFPVSAFFLAGKKAGLYWMLVLILSSLLFLGLASADIISLAYNFVEIRQLLLSVGVVTIGIYAYQQARERSESLIRSEQQKLDQAKNEFLALVSHQLRTLISAIAWFSEMLLHGDAGKLGTEQNDYVKQIYDSNRRSAAIVDAIVTVADLQVQHIHVRLETVDLQTLCHEIVQELQQTHPKKGVAVEEHYDSSNTQLRCDPALARTIVRNLISNALKYTPAGGRVMVSVARTTDHVRPKSQGSLAITVADTGYGIPKNQQQNVFAKLFRASNIKAKDTDGTGLGLYIVKAILDQVGGSIRFESAEGRGSVFTVLLPLEGMRRQVAVKGAKHV